MRQGICCLLSSALTALLWNVAQPAAESQDRSEDRQAIRAHIDSIFRAYIDGDRDTIQATHSETWRGFLSRSSSIVRGIDGYMRNADQALSQPTRMKGYQMTDFDVVFYDEIGVVSYIAKLDIGWKDFFPKIRVLDIYHERDGEWIQVASHTARHPDTVDEIHSLHFPIPEAWRNEVLSAREAVWHAYFQGDVTTLRKVLPPDTLVMSREAPPWVGSESVVNASRRFAEEGGRLLDLAFPETEIRLYGDVAVLYTTFEWKLEVDGEVLEESGRGTEIFVKRDGVWVNPGWHLETDARPSDGE